MQEKHLYTENYQEFNPPAEWEDMRVKATVNDDSFTYEIEEGELTFTGPIASYIMDTYIPAYGVHNGLAYRIVLYTPDGTPEIVFDGFIDLSRRRIFSKMGPIIIKAPIVDETDNLTSFDRVSIFSQLLLKKQGFLTTSNYGHLPIVQVSKRGAKDRRAALLNLSFTIINTFFQIIQDLLSALSDMLGLSLIVGAIEFATLMINVYIQLQQLAELIVQHKDLLLSSQTWYNVVRPKDVVEAAFAKLNKTVEWGIIEPTLDKLWVKSSEYGNIGLLGPGYANEGMLNPEDWGYLVSETIQEIQKLFNTRQHDAGDVVHIKTKKDPSWVNSSTYEPNDLVIETTKQYQNGWYRDKTEEVFATERIYYPYDPSDAWTLTEKNGDSHEVHRELINEINPRFNTLKGLRDTKMNWVMPSRYEPIETILDIFSDILSEYNVNLPVVQDLLVQYSQYIDPSSNASGDTSALLTLPGINFFFALAPGGLKVEDDTWGIPKLIYGDLSDDNIVTIPANFKDHIGGPALYNNWYTYDSPAQEYDFIGQYTEIKDFNLRFGILNFQQTKDNPYFLLNGGNAKFIHIDWQKNDRTAAVEIEKQEIFDSNIKEIVI